jgi:hypothetical protein
MSEEMNGSPEGVTDDTAAALDTSAEATETQAQGDEQSGDDAAAAETEGSAKPKPRKPPQDRIDEVTRNWRETERDRDYWRDLAMRSQPTTKPEAAAADDGEPDPSAYEHGELDARFIRDHATYHAKKTFREEQTAAQARTRAQTAIQTFEQRVEEQFPDGEPDGLARLRDLKAIPPVVTELILDSEIGPKLADHLGNNIRELNRISALPPLQQVRELTKLELKLASPPAPTPKTATDAPAPTPQVRGAGGRFTVAADTDDFAAFEKQFGN